jgi:hypothetical protein
MLSMTVAFGGLGTALLVVGHVHTRVDGDRGDGCCFPAAGSCSTELLGSEVTSHLDEDEPT